MMNLGHIAFIQGHHKKALDCYSKSVTLGLELEEFLDGMESDYEDLRLASLGITIKAYKQLLEEIKQRVDESKK